MLVVRPALQNGIWRYGSLRFFAYPTCMYVPLMNGTKNNGRRLCRVNICHGTYYLVCRHRQYSVLEKQCASEFAGECYAENMSTILIIPCQNRKPRTCQFAMRFADCVKNNSHIAANATFLIKVVGFMNLNIVNNIFFKTESLLHVSLFGRANKYRSASCLKKRLRRYLTLNT